LYSLSDVSHMIASPRRAWAFFAIVVLLDRFARSFLVVFPVRHRFSPAPGVFRCDLRLFTRFSALFEDTLGPSPVDGRGRTGDCVIEYSPEIRLEGRQALRFVIGGIEWSAKPMNQDLREVWDAVFAGRKLYKALLLKRSTA
jgi:hypothetical protein